MRTHMAKRKKGKKKRKEKKSRTSMIRDLLENLVAELDSHLERAVLIRTLQGARKERQRQRRRRRRRGRRTF